MAEAFDPYHKWLGIPPEDQPPDHYRLLGLKALESDRDAIESAADQRMAHLRTYQTGKQSGLSQAMLNEVAAAKICLLNPAKKAAYDDQLRKKLGAPAAAVVEAPAGFNLDDLLGQPASGPMHHSQPKAVVAKVASKQVWILAAAGATAGLLVLIVVVAVLFSGERKEPAQSAKAIAIPQPNVQSPSQPSLKLPDVAAQPKSTVTIASPPIEGVKPAVTVSPVAPPQPKDVAATVASSQTIDLLALVDPAKDALVGEWEVQQSGLAIVRPSFCDLIRIPVIPAGSFEFETEFTRSQGDGCVALLVPAGNSFFHVEVSGYHGRFSGMACINGFSTNDSHNPTSRPSSISSNVRHKLAVRVKGSANNQVTISETFDGSELFRWQGAVSALSGVPFWRMSRPATLGLGTDGAVAVFHTARLRMLDGQAKSPNGKPLVAAGTPDPKVETSQPAAIGPPISPPGEKPVRVAVPSAEAQKESLATLQEIYHFERVTTTAAQVKLANDSLTEYPTQQPT